MLLRSSVCPRFRKTPCQHGAAPEAKRQGLSAEGMTAARKASRLYARGPLFGLTARAMDHPCMRPQWGRSPMLMEVNRGH